MTTDELLRLLDELAEAGCVRVSLTGGEPLLRTDLGCIVQHCKALGFFTWIDSSGFQVPERIDEVANVDAYIGSLDGPPEVQDRQRFAGSFDQQLRAIRAVRERGIPVITYTPLTRTNIGCIEYMLDLAEREDLWVMFTPLMNIPDGTTADTTALMPSHPEFLSAISKILLMKKEGRRVWDSATYLRFLLDWPDCSTTYGIGHDLKHPKHTRCWAGLAHCDIEPDGTVNACFCHVGQWRAHRSQDVGLHEAFQQSRPTDSRCDGCNLAALSELNMLFSLRPSALTNAVKAALVLRRVRERHKAYSVCRGTDGGKAT